MSHPPNRSSPQRLPPAGTTKENVMKIYDRRLGQKRILVVDDDASVREMLTRVLVNEGYLVWGAGNGAEALEIANTASVDLVILDLMLPGESGWDIFERLTTENPLLSVIIATARSDQLFTAAGAGVGALLEKPLDFPKLLQTVGDLLAEPPEIRLARMAGKSAKLHYLPARQQAPAKPRI